MAYYHIGNSLLIASLFKNPLFLIFSYTEDPKGSSDPSPFI